MKKYELIKKKRLTEMKFLLPHQNKKIHVKRQYRLYNFLFHKYILYTYAYHIT